MNNEPVDAECEVKETAIVKTEPKKNTSIATANSLDELSLTDAAKVMMASGLVRNGEDIGKVLTKLSLGRDLNVPTVTALNGIQIGPNSSIILSAALMTLLIKRSGKYKLRVLQRDIKGSKVEVFERVDGEFESCGVPVFFGCDDAKRAGLDNKDTYKKFPVDMYYARAVAGAFRTYCPDCAAGNAVYLPEEIDGSGYKTDVTTGEIVVEAESTPAKGKEKKTKTEEKKNEETILERCIKLIEATNSDINSITEHYKKKSIEELSQSQLINLEENLQKKKKMMPK